MAEANDEQFRERVLGENRLTPGQLAECQAAQAAAAAVNVKASLAQIAVEKGLLTAAQAGLPAPGEPPREFGNYEILGLLGRGGMGTVYRARHRSLQRHVALKILSPHLVHDESFVRRFLREARAAGRLDHENIVRAYDAGEVDGQYFLAMELVEGVSLQHDLERRKIIGADEALAIVLQIARALEHAHEQNLIHRDVKPANILVTWKSVAKLADFGLTKEAGDLSLTRTGASLGTPNYISPEQARGEGAVDIRSDIYSLGATLYHLVTGDLPFKAQSAAGIIAKHLSEELPPPAERNPALSPELARVIERMMAKNPADRYQDPAALAEDLERLQDGLEPVAATLARGRSQVYRQGLLDRVPLLRRIAPRSRPWLAGSVVAVVAVVAGLYFFWPSLAGPKPPTATDRVLAYIDSLLEKLGFPAGAETPPEELLAGARARREQGEPEEARELLAIIQDLYPGQAAAAAAAAAAAELDQAESERRRLAFDSKLRLAFEAFLTDDRRRLAADPYFAAFLEEADTLPGAALVLQQALAGLAGDPDFAAEFGAETEAMRRAMDQAFQERERQLGVVPGATATALGTEIPAALGADPRSGAGLLWLLRGQAVAAAAAEYDRLAAAWGDEWTEAGARFLAPKESGGLYLARLEQWARATWQEMKDRARASDPEGVRSRLAALELYRFTVFGRDLQSRGARRRDRIRRRLPGGGRERP